MNKGLLFFLFLLISISFFSQTKIEKEYRVKPNNVPIKARAYTDSLSVKKIKWYRENNSAFYNYEAKFKYNKQNFSIEFDSIGNLEDIEIEVDFKSLSTQNQNFLCEKLDSLFEKCKIIKIQKQYIVNASKLIALMNNKNDIKLYGYEIIVKGKEQDKHSNLYELFFSQKLTLERKNLILLKNTDHLDF